MQRAFLRAGRRERSVLKSDGGWVGRMPSGRFGIHAQRLGLQVQSFQMGKDSGATQGHRGLPRGRDEDTVSGGHPEKRGEDLPHKGSSDGSGQPADVRVLERGTVRNG